MDSTDQSSISVVTFLKNELSQIKHDYDRKIALYQESRLLLQSRWHKIAKLNRKIQQFADEVQSLHLEIGENNNQIRLMQGGGELSDLFADFKQSYHHESLAKDLTTKNNLKQILQSKISFINGKLVQQQDRLQMQSEAVKRSQHLLSSQPTSKEAMTASMKARATLLIASQIIDKLESELLKHTIDLEEVEKDIQDLTSDIHTLQIQQQTSSFAASAGYQQVRSTAPSSSSLHPMISSVIGPKELVEIIQPLPGHDDGRGSHSSSSNGLHSNNNHLQLPVFSSDLVEASLSGQYTNMLLSSQLPSQLQAQQQQQASATTIELLDETTAMSAIYRMQGELPQTYLSRIERRLFSLQTIHNQLLTQFVSQLLPQVKQAHDAVREVEVKKLKIELQLSRLETTQQQMLLTAEHHQQLLQLQYTAPPLSSSSSAANSSSSRRMKIESLLNTPVSQHQHQQLPGGSASQSILLQTPPSSSSAMMSFLSPLSAATASAATANNHTANTAAANLFPAVSSSSQYSNSRYKQDYNVNNNSSSSYDYPTSLSKLAATAIEDPTAAAALSSPSLLPLPLPPPPPSSMHHSAKDRRQLLLQDYHDLEDSSNGSNGKTVTTSRYLTSQRSPSLLKLSNICRSDLFLENNNNNDGSSRQPATTAADRILDNSNKRKEEVALDVSPTSSTGKKSVKHLIYHLDHSKQPTTIPDYARSTSNSRSRSRSVSPSPSPSPTYAGSINNNRRQQQQQQQQSNNAATTSRRPSRSRSPTATAASNKSKTILAAQPSVTSSTSNSSSGNGSAVGPAVVDTMVILRSLVRNILREAMVIKQPSSHSNNNSNQSSHDDGMQQQPSQSHRLSMQSNERMIAMEEQLVSLIDLYLTQAEEATTMQQQQQHQQQGQHIEQPRQEQQHQSSVTAEVAQHTSSKQQPAMLQTHPSRGQQQASQQQAADLLPTDPPIIEAINNNSSNQHLQQQDNLQMLVNLLQRDLFHHLDQSTLTSLLQTIQAADTKRGRYYQQQQQNKQQQQQQQQQQQRPQSQLQGKQQQAGVVQKKEKKSSQVLQSSFAAIRQQYNLPDVVSSLSPRPKPAIAVEVEEGQGEEEEGNESSQSQLHHLDESNPTIYNQGEGAGNNGSSGSRLPITPTHSSLTSSQVSSIKGRKSIRIASSKPIVVVGKRKPAATAVSHPLPSSSKSYVPLVPFHVSSLTTTTKNQSQALANKAQHRTASVKDLLVNGHVHHTSYTRQYRYCYLCATMPKHSPSAAAAAAAINSTTSTTAVAALASSQVVAAAVDNGPTIDKKADDDDGAALKNLLQAINSQQQSMAMNNQSVAGGNNGSDHQQLTLQTAVADILSRLQEQEMEIQRLQQLQGQMAAQEQAQAQQAKEQQAQEELTQQKRKIDNERQTSLTAVLSLRHSATLRSPRAATNNNSSSNNSSSNNSSLGGINIQPDDPSLLMSASSFTATSSIVLTSSPRHHQPRPAAAANSTTRQATIVSSQQQQQQMPSNNNKVSSSNKPAAVIIEPFTLQQQQASPRPQGSPMVNDDGQHVAAARQQPPSLSLAAFQQILPDILSLSGHHHRNSSSSSSSNNHKQRHQQLLSCLQRYGYFYHGENQCLVCTKLFLQRLIDFLQGTLLARLIQLELQLGQQQQEAALTSSTMQHGPAAFTLAIDIQQAKHLPMMKRTIATHDTHACDPYVEVVLLEFVDHHHHPEQSSKQQGEYSSFLHRIQCFCLQQLKDVEIDLLALPTHSAAVHHNQAASSAAAAACRIHLADSQSNGFGEDIAIALYQLSVSVKDYQRTTVQHGTCYPTWSETMKLAASTADHHAAADQQQPTVPILWLIVRDSSSKLTGIMRNMRDDIIAQAFLPLTKMVSLDTAAAASSAARQQQQQQSSIVHKLALPLRLPHPSRLMKGHPSLDSNIQLKVHVTITTMLPTYRYRILQEECKEHLYLLQHNLLLHSLSEQEERLEAEQLKGSSYGAAADEEAEDKEEKEIGAQLSARFAIKDEQRLGLHRLYQAVTMLGSGAKVNSDSLLQEDGLQQPTAAAHHRPRKMVAHTTRVPRQIPAPSSSSSSSYDDHGYHHYHNNSQQPPPLKSGIKQRGTSYTTTPTTLAAAATSFVLSSDNTTAHPIADGRQEQQSKRKEARKKQLEPVDLFAAAGSGGGGGYTAAPNLSIFHASGFRQGYFQSYADNNSKNSKSKMKHRLNGDGK